MIYCDYAFYTGEYFGNSITEAEFPRLASRASDYIWNYTKGLSDRVSGRSLEQVKKCTCALAEVLKDEDTMHASAFAAGGVKTSETVGPHSQGFSSGLTAAAVEELDKRKQDALFLYLGNLSEFAGLFRTVSYRCAHDARWRG